MIEAYKKFLRNYANFKGRSTRADYWYVVLCNVIIGFVLGFLGGLLHTSIFLVIAYIYELAVMVPGLAISIRRLHDVNQKWSYIFMGLIPIAGAIILIVQYCKPSVNEGNNFGEIVQ